MPVRGAVFPPILAGKDRRNLREFAKGKAKQNGEKSECVDF